ncbi:MAG: hypothetical protein EHM42_04495 [Planctomycetaceae bacterium]|nr:MAG: hypothetical protein EHM42_04495 [Planctomycetaceae bacterium]
MLRPWKLGFGLLLVIVCPACRGVEQKQVKYQRQKPAEKYSIVDSRRYAAEQLDQIPVGSKVTVETTDSKRSVNGWVKSVSPTKIVLADADEMVARLSDEEVVQEIVQAGGSSARSSGKRYSHRTHESLEIPANQVRSIRQFRQ